MRTMRPSGPGGGGESISRISSFCSSADPLPRLLVLLRREAFDVAEELGAGRAVNSSRWSFPPPTAEQSSGGLSGRSAVAVRRPSTCLRTWQRPRPACPRTSPPAPGCGRGRAFPARASPASGPPLRRHVEQRQHQVVGIDLGDVLVHDQPLLNQHALQRAVVLGAGFSSRRDLLGREDLLLQQQLDQQAVSNRSVDWD